VRVGAILVAALWPAAAGAYRPFDSTDAAVAAPGEMEIELGLGHMRESTSRELTAPRLVLNLGLLQRTELVLEGRAVFLCRADLAPSFRLGDPALLAKGILREGRLQEGSGPSIAAEAGVLLPEINGETGVGVSAALIVSQQWTWLTVHLDGEIQLTRTGALGLFGGLIVEGPDRWIVRPVGEVFLAHEGGGAGIVSGLLGAIWRVREDLAFDAAFRWAHHGSLAAHELRLGLTWSFSAWGA
jgi:hypothetical protein